MSIASGARARSRAIDGASCIALCFVATLAACGGGGGGGSPTPPAPPPPATTLRLIAGEMSGFGDTDGTAGDARFWMPQAVAVDNVGTVYVADSANSVIRRISGGNVTTLAGAPRQPGSADGTGSAARFTAPLGIAVDTSGNVFVADTGNHTIRRITPAGVVTTIAGAAGVFGATDGAGATARFNQPRGLAIDPAGNLWIADSGNFTIRAITPAGAVATVAGAAGVPGSADGAPASARFNRPVAIAVGPANVLYVADEDNFTVRRLTPSPSGGTVSTFAGQAGAFGSTDGVGAAARFGRVRGVAVDAAGNVFVTGGHALRAITPVGETRTVAGSTVELGSADGVGMAVRFDTPGGLAVDGAGTLYIADRFNSTIRRANAGGGVGTFAGTAPQYGSVDANSGAARFAAPIGIAAGASGSLIVADNRNNTIRRIAANGDVSTIAGTAGTTGSGDGMSAAARFDGPFGLAVDSAGNTYVADSFNHTIRRIAPNGAVTTLAGTAGTSGSTDGVGGAALFSSPAHVAVDAAGNVYVADTLNHAIRRVTPAGVVTTHAGGLGLPGSADGAAAAARFNFPHGIAVDNAGNVHVADAGNHTVRRISTGGQVTTVAGSAGDPGSVDGTVASARFRTPISLATDADGAVYVATIDPTIRKISGGNVTTVVGTLEQAGFAPGSLPAVSWVAAAMVVVGNDLYFTTHNGVAVASGVR